MQKLNVNKEYVISEMAVGWTIRLVWEEKNISSNIE